MRTITVPRVQHRTFSVERMDRAKAERAKGEAARYALSFSSEEPVLRWSWDVEGFRYYEVLSHAQGDVDMSVASKGLPLFKSHDRFLHCGTVWDVENEEEKRRLVGDAEFSSIPLGQEEETKLIEGHTRTVSVGYEVLSMEFAGKDLETGIPTYRCAWRPREVSVEPMAADNTVGFGRGMPDGADKRDSVEFKVVEEERAAEPLMEGARTMGNEVITGAGAPAAPVITGGGGVRLDPPGASREAEIAEIVGMAESHGLFNKVREWLDRKLTADQVRREILEQVTTRARTQPPAESLDLPARDRNRYSMVRAIAMHVDMKTGVRRNYDGLEGEIHQELGRSRVGTDHGGILVPLRLSDPNEPPMPKRTLGTTESTGGASLVLQQAMPDMIDLLRNRACCLLAGARFLSGLRNVVYFARKSAAATVEWMAENPTTGATASEPQYGFVALTPKTLIGTVPIPRQLLTMASWDVEQDVRNDLATGTALALDLGALHGTGTDKQPVGVYSAAGVLSHAVGGVPDLEDVTKMPALVADKNADIGTMAWMTTPLMAGVLKRTQVVSGQSDMIWEGTFRDGDVLGYRAFATNQVSKTLGAGTNEHGLIFANWSDLMIGMWGNELELVVDEVTLASKGQIVITSFAMGDTAILRTDSFCKGTGATIA